MVLGLITFGCSNKMTATTNTAIQLTGETVTISYVANPAMARGQYKLTNSGDNAVEISVHAVWVELGGRRQALNDFSVYDRKLEQTLNPQKFTLDAKSTMNFFIGFPKFSYEHTLAKKAQWDLPLV